MHRLFFDAAYLYRKACADRRRLLTWRMEKKLAIELLGGTVGSLSRACGITSSAVSQWPEKLNRDQTDRVQAALWRAQQARRARKKPTAAQVDAAELIEK